MEAKFKCPKCQGTRLEEIMSDVVVASEIYSIEFEDGEADCNYGDQTNDDGVIDRFQCMGCGFHIPQVGSDEDATTLFEAAEWIAAQG